MNGMQVTRDGFVVGGSPVGTASYMTEHVQQKVDSILSKMGAVSEYGREHPQAAYALIGPCLTTTLTHLLRTTPPYITADGAAKFDLAVRQLRLDLLAVGEEECSMLRMERAHALAELPKGSGGLGHTPASEMAAAAYLAIFVNARYSRIAELTNYADDVKV